MCSCALECDTPPTCADIQPYCTATSVILLIYIYCTYCQRSIWVLGKKIMKKTLPEPALVKKKCGGSIALYIDSGPLFRSIKLLLLLQCRIRITFICFGLISMCWQRSTAVRGKLKNTGPYGVSYKPQSHHEASTQLLQRAVSGALRFLLSTWTVQQRAIKSRPTTWKNQTPCHLLQDVLESSSERRRREVEDERIQACVKCARE